MTPSARNKLLLQLAQLDSKLRRLYGQTYSEVLTISEIRNAIESEEDNFTWKNHPNARKKLENLLKRLNTSTANLIMSNVKSVRSEATQESLRYITASVSGEKMASNEKKELSGISEQIQRRKADSAHKKREIEISNSVWKYSEQAKKEIEVIIQNAILQGKSADETTAELKKYLNNPDALFRRVRNKNGDLVLSKAAREYHPGAGVYRSAYKNALRLARTEMNMAYRLSEWESYQNNPLVKAYEIRLSNNHTTPGKNGDPVALVDICDELAGIYPKWFKWVGWHPQCRCVMIPITLTPAEFGEYRKAKQEGKLSEWQAKQGRAELPDNFVNWLTSRKGDMVELMKQGRLPYFMRDNFATESDIKNVVKAQQKGFDITKCNYNFVSVDDITSMLIDIETNLEGDAKMFPLTKVKNGKLVKYFGNIYIENESLKILVTKQKGVNGMADLKGNIWLSQKASDAILSALRKIKNGKINSVSFEEAQYLCTVWHEIWHTRHGFEVINGSLGTKARQFMELANEFVARNTLDQFMSFLGLEESMSKRFILQSRPATSYNRWVLNYQKIIDVCKLDKSRVLSAVADGLKNKSYKEQKKVLISALKSADIHKIDGSKLKASEIDSLLEGCRTLSEDSFEWMLEVMIGTIK